MGAVTATVHEIVFTVMRHREHRGYPPNWQRDARAIVALISEAGWKCRHELINRIQAAVLWHEALWARAGDSHAR